ncbi:hypothetical protein TPCV2_02130 [Cutibacterium avidum]|nr:hypothetical protein TPCV4_08060 [Cutibacterium avidum]
MSVTVTVLFSTSVTVTGSFWPKDPSTGFGSDRSGTSVRPRRLRESGSLGAAVDGVAECVGDGDVVGATE